MEELEHIKTKRESPEKEGNEDRVMSEKLKQENSSKKEYFQCQFLSSEGYDKHRKVFEGFCN